MAFYEQRLDLGINYGATFGPRFNTAILTQSDGQEQRRALWSQPLIVAQIGDRMVKEAKLQSLIAFHAAVKGSADGFRLRDWSDYKAVNQAIGTGNGTPQTWQLVKRYSISTATVTRPITKPLASTLTVFVDGVATATGWALDETTGVLTTELTGVISASFEFDIPVRFDQDKIDFTFEAKGLFNLAPLTCTEIRLEPTLYPPLDALPGSLEEIIDLGYDFGTLGGPAFSTGIKSNAAEFEKRKPYWQTAIGAWDIGDRLLLGSELDYLISLFRVCRGMAIPFRFKDWQTNTIKKVRFAEDRISFRFDAYGNDEVIFNLGGVAIKEISTPIGSGYWRADIQSEEYDINGNFLNKFVWTDDINNYPDHLLQGNAVNLSNFVPNFNGDPYDIYQIQFKEVQSNFFGQCGNQYAWWIGVNGFLNHITRYGPKILPNGSWDDEAQHWVYPAGTCSGGGAKLIRPTITRLYQYSDYDNGSPINLVRILTLGSDYSYNRDEVGLLSFN